MWTKKQAEDFIKHVAKPSGLVHEVLLTFDSFCAQDEKMNDEVDYKKLAQESLDEWINVW